MKEKAGFSLFGLPSSGSNSGTERLPLAKRQKPLDAENIDKAKAEQRRKLELEKAREAARIKAMELQAKADAPKKAKSVAARVVLEERQMKADAEMKR